MTLILQIENFAVLDDGGPVSVAIPPSGLHAGRSAGMGWVLPDPSRHISGHHFDVMPDRDGWYLHDRSTNGTFLQGHRHRLGAPHLLSHGERFQVGPYVIVALFDTPPAEAAVPVGSLPPYLGTAGGEDAVVPSDDPWAVAGGFEPVNPLPPMRSTGRGRGDDFAAEFVAFPMSVPGATPVSAPAPPGPSRGDPVVHALAPAVAPQPPAQRPAAAPVPVPLPPGPLAGAVPPSPAGPAAAPPPPAAALPPVPPQAFVAAFCRGAGLSPELAAGADAEALAEALGRTVAASATGLMAALRDRSAARHFTRAGERTMRSASDNNPLKFLPSEQDALEALFLRPRAGFQTGPDGFAHAIDDMRRHQAALFAAIQPALAELLADLDPSQIEAETKGRAGLQGQRKARAWDSYVERWDAKAAHENGILTEFIRLFAEAYRSADATLGPSGKDHA